MHINFAAATTTKQNLFNLAFIALLICVALLSLAFLAFRPVPAVFIYQFQEDGYIALSIARNIGVGRGITYDGHTLTNGFQPLWVFLLAPIFALTGGNRELACRLIILLQTAVCGATCYMIFRVLNDATSPLFPQRRRLFAAIAAALFVCSRQAWGYSFSGMETGLLLLAYVATFRLYQRLDFSKWAHYVVLGLWLGCLVLVRIDASFFVLWTCCLNVTLPSPKSYTRRLKESLIIGGSAAFVTAPWWLYNISYFGSVMPSSGHATSSSGVSLSHILLAIYAVLKNLVSQVQSNRIGERDAALLHIGLLAVTIGIIVKSYSQRIISAARNDEMRANVLVAPSCALILSALMLLVWYSWQSAASWFYPRYLSIFVLIGSVIMAAAIVALSEKSRFAVPVLLSAVALFYFWAVAHAFAPVPDYGLPHREPRLVLVTRHVPLGDVVASGQVGILGFFREGVFNLDGKVNSEANKFHGRVTELIERYEINWVCDSPYYLRPLGFSGTDPEWRVVEQLGNTTLYKRFAR